MYPTVSAYFTVTSSDPAVDITGPLAQTALVPYHVWTMGEPRVSPTGHQYPGVSKFSGWSVRVGPRESVDLPAVLNELLELLLPVESVIERCTQSEAVSAEIGIVVKMDEQAPIGTISSEVVAFAARHGAEIDLDLYAWREAEPE